MRGADEREQARDSDRDDRDRGDSVYPAMESPDQLLVIAAGGPAGGFGAVIPPWLGNKSHAVTLPIGACVDCEPPKK